jgi:Na+/H+ antiporter NhaC
MDWILVIPPIVAIVAIVVVLWCKEVIASLLLAIFSAELLQIVFNWQAPLAVMLNTIERIVSVFSDADTTAVFSIVSGSDLLEHVRMQLPYALFGGGITLSMYVVAGIVML